MDRSRCLLLSLALLPAFLACGSSPPPRASSPDEVPLASAAPALGAGGPRADGRCVVAVGEPKALILRLADALARGDREAWEREQSARFRNRADEGLSDLRFQSWTQGLKGRQEELKNASCRSEDDSTRHYVICDTRRPLRVQVAHENCTLRLDDN